MKIKTIALAAAALSASALPALAHHSFAMFDRQKETVLKGTVKTFQWTNPHSFIEIEVVDPQAAVTPYSIEMNSPNNLVHEGWKRSSIKAGDKVTVKVSPLRDGRPGGLYIGITLADGKYLGRRPSFDRHKLDQVWDGLAQGHSISTISLRTGLTRQAIYRIRDNPAEAEAMLLEEALA